MEICDAPETRCSQCVSVISVGKSGKPGLFRKTGLLEVLARHLNGHFDSCRAIIGIENASKPAIRKQIYQLFRQSCSWEMSQPEEGTMRNLRQLLSDRTVDSRMIMTVDVGPN